MEVSVLSVFNSLIFMRKTSRSLITIWLEIFSFLILIVVRWGRSPQR